ncbi:MAG: amidohydrolase family protein [Litorimonas sp.]
MNASAAPTLYINGYWYKDDASKISFEKGQRYQVDGVFVVPPNSIDRQSIKVIDLEERYIVPPFGEAHNHSVDGPWTLQTAERYMSQGIFYYKNPNNLASAIQGERARWAKPDTLDVIFSHGGLSVDEGHPEQLYKSMAPMMGLDPEQLDGSAFFDVETVKKLAAQWPHIMSKNPDFLKVYLLNHDKSGDGQSEGLSEEMFKNVLAKAKQAGLRTTVHVETAADLALAVQAGATETGHLPGYAFHYDLEPSDFRISTELANMMAEKEFITVTTTVISEPRYKDNPEILAKVFAQQAENLSTLKIAGAPIAIGADSFTQTSLDEIKSLRKFNVFTDEELLRLWVNTPSLSIFPDRAIGALKPDYEASFVALECNPIDNFDCIERIVLAVKQGVLLQ